MEMCAQSPFEILRCDFHYNNGKDIQNGCQSYISTIYNSSYDYRLNYCYNFTAQKEINYSHKEPNGLAKMKFYYKINATEAEKGNVGIALLNITIYSPGQ